MHGGTGWRRMRHRDECNFQHSGWRRVGRDGYPDVERRRFGLLHGVGRFRLHGGNLYDIRNGRRWRCWMERGVPRVVKGRPAARKGQFRAIFDAGRRGALIQFLCWQRPLYSDCRFGRVCGRHFSV